MNLPPRLFQGWAIYPSARVTRTSSQQPYGLSALIWVLSWTGWSSTGGMRFTVSGGKVYSVLTSVEKSESKFYADGCPFSHPPPPCRSTGAYLEFLDALQHIPNGFLYLALRNGVSYCETRYSASIPPAAPCPAAGSASITRPLPTCCKASASMACTLPMPRAASHGNSTRIR